MVKTPPPDLDSVLHGEMAPGFMGLLLGQLVDRLVEAGNGPADAAGIRAPVRAFSMLTLLADGDQSVTELAKRLGVTHAAVIKTARALDRLGFLGRGDDPADARRKPLGLTADGRREAALIATYMARVSAVYRDVFEESGVDLFAAACAFEGALQRESFAARFNRAGTQAGGDAELGQA